MGTLFVSDLHLHPSRPHIIESFLKFLRQQASNAEALYILGDLFDAWIGDDSVDPDLAPVLKGLRACTDSGIPVFLLHGNRDFLIGERFTAETGCQLISDPARLDLYGTPTLLMHGDTLCTDDTDYQQLRKMVRNPAWQEQALSLSAAERQQLAIQARELSLLATGHKDDSIMDVNAEEVKRVMRKHQVRLLIHGHTHRPGEHKVDLGEHTARRIVLGDWYTCGDAIELAGDRISRVRVQ